jgi:hypothetical protein
MNISRASDRTFACENARASVFHLVTTAIAELARLKAEQDETALHMEDLCAMRSLIVLSGTEADVEAHDARFMRAQRRHERAVAAVERARGSFEGPSFPQGEAKASTSPRFKAP